MELIPGNVYQVLPQKSFMAHRAQYDLFNEQVFVALTGPVDRTYWNADVGGFEDRCFYMILCEGVVMKMHNHIKDLELRVRLVS